MSFVHSQLTAASKTLGNIRTWLEKAEAHAAARSYDPAVLLAARLAPDQFPLVKQIQVASDWVKNGHARLANKQPPSHSDAAQTFDELRARIATCLEYASTFSPTDFAGAEERIISSTRTPGKGALGLDYLAETVMPNFFFHATTTYAILRHNGVELGKSDFIGSVKLRDL